MKGSEYWRERALILEEAAHRKGEELAQVAERDFRAAARRLQDETETWYARMSQNNGVSLVEARRMLPAKELEEFRWSVEEYIQHGEENALDGRWMRQLENASARVHISRLEALQLQLQQKIELLCGGQLDDLDKVLRGVYSEGYYHTAFEVQRGFGLGWDLQSLDEQRLDAVLSRPWTTDGRTFRDRCWANKEALVRQIQTTLTQGLIRGDGADRMTREIAERMGVSAGQAARLVMTETAYFSARSQQDCYKELGVEQFEVVETLDGHTCGICQGLDGQVLPLSAYEPGVTAPPFHPWCRGCTAPWFSDNFGERAARDREGKVYYLPGEVTYRDWEKTFVVDPDLSRQLYDRKRQQRELEKRTWKDIWKEPVSAADYGQKKNAVASKREYFAHKLSSTTGRERERFEALAKSLDEFENAGRQYAVLQSQIDDLAEKLTTLRAGDTIKVEPYCRARKDAAYWFSQEAEADRVLRGPTGEIWKAWSREQRTAAYEYTAGSGKFNRPLRGYRGGWDTYEGPGKVPLNQEGGETYIRDLTEGLAGASYDFDIWLQRGVETDRGAALFLGVPESALLGSVEDMALEVVGKVVRDEAFLSTSAVKGGGFDGVIFNIYAPRGTRMIYAEPFSSFGLGAGLEWDGVSQADAFGTEFEVILQRGSEYRITKAEKNGDTWYFDMEVLLPEGGDSHKR